MASGFVRELLDLDEPQEVALQVLRLLLEGRVDAEDVLADHLRVLEGRVGVLLVGADVLGEFPALQLELSPATLLLLQSFLRIELAS